MAVTSLASSKHEYLDPDHHARDLWRQGLNSSYVEAVRALWESAAHLLNCHRRYVQPAQIHVGIDERLRIATITTSNLKCVIDTEGLSRSDYLFRKRDWQLAHIASRPELRIPGPFVGFLPIHATTLS